jgi:hypothetical protein
MKESWSGCFALWFVVLSAVSGFAGEGKTVEGISIATRADRLVVELDGKPFAEYVFTNTSRPYLYPVFGPNQALMTRNWPMKEVAGEARDHPHHKGLWYSHGAVNGIDFWSEAPGAGRIVHQRFTSVKPGKNAGLVRSENQWLSKDGKVICTDTRTLQFRKSAKNLSSRIIDFEIEISASHGDLRFGDTKEGTMAIRIAESMRLTGGQGKGRIVNSRGVRDKATWGQRAEWCDYYGPVEGGIVGVAMFDHPSNPRHPTWWHVRDYGLFAANPFGQHDFEKLSNASAGDLEVKSGSSVKFVYRFLFHEGDEVKGKVAEEWAEFVK